MDRKKLAAVRQLCEKTGILQLYAERVVDGRMALDEAQRRSFGEVRSHKAAPEPASPASRPSVVLSFDLDDEAADLVLEALEVSRRALGRDASRSQGLVEMARRARAWQEPPRSKS